MWVSSARGLVWSINWESWEPPKNSLTAATTGRTFISSAGVARAGSRVGGHPLTNHPLHTQEAHAQLVLEKLAHGPYPAVAQVVDVVRGLAAVVDQDHLPDHGYQVFLGEVALRRVQGKAQPAVQLVAAHVAQVVPAGLKKRPCIRLRAFSTLGGSPGLRRR